MVSYKVAPPSTYNEPKLRQELAALPDFDGLGIINQGLPGERWDVQFLDDTLTTQQDVEDVMTSHNPAVQTDQQRWDAVHDSAKVSFEALPGWATWTIQQAEDHIETNVTDLASAKVVLKAMAKAIVALRNARWPGLQGG